MSRLPGLLMWALTLSLGVAWFARAQVVTQPAAPTAAVCAFNTSPPTISSGNFAYVQCTATGQLLLH